MFAKFLTKISGKLQYFQIKSLWTVNFSTLPHILNFRKIEKVLIFHLNVTDNKIVTSSTRCDDDVIKTIHVVVQEAYRYFKRRNSIKKQSDFCT